ncbi:photosystem II reaction center protein J [Zarconia navalis]|uniref:photosystem II reaction center protein J n=1 Tax=Zarconia navalis TaxID=2992134 RepID=UPI003F923761
METQFKPVTSLEARISATKVAGSVKSVKSLLSIVWRSFKMSEGGKIPLWIVGTIAGLGAVGILFLFFYGSYGGVGSAL